MRLPLIFTVVLVAFGATAGAQPAAQAVPDVRAYTQAMNDTLAGMGVRLQKIDSPRDELLVIYSLESEASAPEFALATVLRLAQPLGEGMERIRVRNVQGRRTLIEVQVSPDQVAHIVASTVDERQQAQIDVLLAAVLLAGGVELAAPDQTDQPEQTEALAPVGVRVAQQPAAPVEAPQSEALATFEDAGRVVVVPRQEQATVLTDEQGIADALLERLVQADLENVSIARDSAGQWVIGFENRTWRTDLDAIARAIEEINAVLPPTTTITVEIRRHDVVVSHVVLDLADYERLRGGILSSQALADRWNVSAGRAAVAEPVALLARDNRSHLRTDLLLRPAISYHIGLEHDPFITDYFILTNLRTTLAPGVWANLRFPAQLTSNQRVTMDRALLGWVGRPLDGVIATGSAGKFRDDRLGYYGEVRTDSDTHQFGLLGSLVDADQFRINPADKFGSLLGYYQYDFGNLGLKTRLSYGQFIESGDQGLALSLRRRYGESVVETRAIRTDGGREGLTFELSVPLGPRRASSPGDLRLRSDTALHVNYISDFNVQGDHLRGDHDIESFRGELSPAYLRGHGERLVGGPDRVSPDWPVAPSYEGTSGLIRIPTADVAPDGRIFTGVSYFDRAHSKVKSADTDAMPTFLGFGFLPNLEIAGRLTFFHDVTAFNWGYNLDRSLNVHYRLMRQRGDWTPAIAVGAQDILFGTAVSYLGEGDYVVGTLQRDRMRAHLGLGSGKFDPVFGGFEMSVGHDNRLHAMAEYDSDFVNAGLRWFLDDWGTASISLLGLRSLTGSVTFQTDLP